MYEHNDSKYSSYKEMTIIFYRYLRERGVGFCWCEMRCIPFQPRKVRATVRHPLFCRLLGVLCVTQAAYQKLEIKSCQFNVDNHILDVAKNKTSRFYDQATLYGLYKAVTS